MNSTITDNSSQGSAGGGGVYCGGTAGSITLINCTVSDNVNSYFNGGGGGGGLCDNHGPDPSAGGTTIINSTITGNTANGGDGGGLELDNGSLTLSTAPSPSIRPPATEAVFRLATTPN